MNALVRKKPEPGREQVKFRNFLGTNTQGVEWPTQHSASEGLGLCIRTDKAAIDFVFVLGLKHGRFLRFGIYFTSHRRFGFREF